MICVGIPVASAGELSMRAQASVDRSDVLVGDPIHYVVAVTHPQGVTIEWPSIDATVAGVTVEASGAQAPRTSHGITTEARWYRLAGYSPGTHTIPETVVKFQTADGAPHEARTQALTITVKSLLPGDWEHQDIRDVKPLIPLRSAWQWLLVVALAALGGIAGLWWRGQRRHLETPSSPPRPPHEIAFDALSRLRQEDLPSRNRYEEYYLRLSGIVRAYIEGRFGVRAREMTTEEFLQAASNAQALSVSHRRLLQDFLERCDLVKFARYEPSRHEAHEAFEAAHRFIRDTAPSPEPAANQQVVG